MSVAWVAVGVSALGLAANVAGQNKQQSASDAATAQNATNVADTNAQNAANVKAQNDQAWTNYLLQRGLSTGGVVPAGTMPSSGQAVNTRLPLWATVNVPSRFAGPGGSAMGGVGTNRGGGGGGYGSGSGSNSSSGGSGSIGSQFAMPGGGYDWQGYSNLKMQPNDTAALAGLHDVAEDPYATNANSKWS